MRRELEAQLRKQEEEHAGVVERLQSQLIAERNQVRPVDYRVRPDIDLCDAIRVGAGPLNDRQRPHFRGVLVALDEGAASSE